MKSLDQARARMAWGQVSEFKQQHPGDFKKYRSLARNFPSMVQSMGIGQSVAFLMSKKKEASHREFLEHVTTWLRTGGNIPWNPVPDPRRPLMHALTQQSTSESWWYADREAIQYAVWLKRFAEALTDAEKPTVERNDSAPAAKG